jgi:phosphoenolpyruvate-protein phosphotransferase (PTS system enzyme I)
VAANNKPEAVFYGNGVSPGIVPGQALKLDSDNRVTLKIRVDDVEEEIRRFLQAKEAAKEQLASLKTRLEAQVGKEHSFILDVHLLMLEDRGLIEEIITIIREHRANAEWAVRKATDRIRDAYASLEDEYFRDRKSDINSVVERLLLNLSGGKPSSWGALPRDLIVVAHDFSPSAFAAMDLEKVVGLALESGGRTSHTAIIARSLRLPAVMEARDFLSWVNTGDAILLNGDEGQIIVNPTPERLAGIRPRMIISAGPAELTPARPDTATRTRDGILISLQANTELPDEIRLARRCGAEGIGLFRSEFLFFGHPTGKPTLSDQLETYAMLAREMSPYPVAIRTLDIGADKLLPSSGTAADPNPSMGLRGIRLSLIEKESFATQVEAILLASRAGQMEIVLPMVSAVEEVHEAKSLIDRVRSRIADPTEPAHPAVRIGVMIEVPAAVYTLEALASEVDFICVGTNDLIQYLLAVDRGNPQVAHLFQPLHPSVLQCLKQIATVCSRLGKPVRICGEISSNPFYAVLLVGMGFTCLSMNPLAMPTIRKVIQEISLQAAREVADRALTLASAREISDYVVDAISGLVPVDLQPYVREISTLRDRTKSSGDNP